MSGKAGKSGDGNRRTPGKKGESPLRKMESNEKADAVKSIQRDAVSPRPAPPEAVKREVTMTDPNQESKDSKVTVGNTVAAKDEQTKGEDQDIQVLPNAEESPVASKSESSVVSRSEVKVGDPERVSKSEERSQNKFSKESKQSSPEGRVRFNFISNNGNSKTKASPESSKPQRQDNRYYGTRNSIVLLERDKFLAMTVNEKRKFYSHKDYVMLDEIDAWPKFYSRNIRSLKKLYPSAKEVEKVLNDLPNIKVDERLNAKVSLFEGDITSLEIDGIVNAANSLLLGGGGVDGAIHRAAGSQLLAECQTMSGCETGNAKTTCGYKLPAKYVIHTVGPQATSRTDLQNCYKSCFREMVKHSMHSIAFCCISTGIYGYPNDLAVRDALGSTRKYLTELRNIGKIDTIDRIIFCLFLKIDIDLYKSWMQVFFPTETREGFKYSNKNNSGATEISSDSDSPASGKECRVNCRASGSLDSCTIDLAEKNALDEDMDEEVDTDDDHLQKTRSNDSAGSPGDALPDKKSKMDPGVKCSPKSDI